MYRQSVCSGLVKPTVLALRTLWIPWELWKPYAASICSGLRGLLGRENKFVTEFFSMSAFGAMIADKNCYHEPCLR